MAFSGVAEKAYFSVQIVSGNAKSVKLFDSGIEVTSGQDLSFGSHELTLVVEDLSGHTTESAILVTRLAPLAAFFSMFLFVVTIIVIADVVIYAIYSQKLKHPTAQRVKPLSLSEMIKIGAFPFPYYHKEKQERATESSPRTKMLRNLSIAWISSAILFLLLLVGLLIPADASKLPEPTELATTQTSSLDTASNVGQETANLSETNLDTEASLSPDTSSGTSNASQDIMSGISISEAADVAYDRSDYQSGWSVGTGCDLRARILQITSLISVTTSSNGCTVIYGSWIDPYTGETLTGNPYRGDGTANDLDIDHIIPLTYVNSHGGADWTNAEKKSYGQSLDGYKNGVYVAVSSSENRKKADSGPSEYYPPNASYRCEYATKWRDIARIYGISLDQADYDVVESILIECSAT